MTNDLKNASALQIVLRTYEFLSLASYIKNLVACPNVHEFLFISVVMITYILFKSCRVDQKKDELNLFLCYIQYLQALL